MNGQMISKRYLHVAAMMTRASPRLSDRVNWVNWVNWVKCEVDDVDADGDSDTIQRKVSLSVHGLARCVLSRCSCCHPNWLVNQRVHSGGSPPGARHCIAKNERLEALVRRFAIPEK